MPIRELWMGNDARPPFLARHEALGQLSPLRMASDPSVVTRVHTLGAHGYKKIYIAMVLCGLRIAIIGLTSAGFGAIRTDRATYGGSGISSALGHLNVARECYGRRRATA